MTVTTDLQRQLVNYIVSHSGHESHRRYIGLSGIADCVQVIYDRYINGALATISERMKTAISYDLEKILIEKLIALRVYRGGELIYLHDGLVQGHTDGWIKDDLLEIKTVEKEEWFPQERVPFRVFCQVQAYLHYLNGVRFAQVLYLARDTGAVQMYGIRRHLQTGEDIEQRLNFLVEAVKTMQRPECSCGKCNQ